MCNRALRQDLHNKKAAKLLGEIELGDNNLAKAEIILYRLGGRESKDAEVLNLLGLIALRRDKVDEAYELFQMGLKSDEDNPALRMNLGVIHLQYRQIDQAAKEFEAVLKTTPNHIDAKLHLAIIKAYKQDNEGAKSLYEEVIEGDKNNHFALYNLALLQQRMQELDPALKHIQRALKSKDFSAIQTKLAEELRDELIGQIKQREEEEQKRKEEENQKKLDERKTTNANSMPNGSKPDPA
jgi:tetratricopeptide (TPR) repeat protein